MIGICNSVGDGVWSYTPHLQSGMLLLDHCDVQPMCCGDDRVNSVSSHEPAVSTIGLCSESSPGSVVSEEPFRPQFTMDHQRGLSGF